MAPPEHGICYIPHANIKHCSQYLMLLRGITILSMYAALLECMLAHDANTAILRAGPLTSRDVYLLSCTSMATYQ